MLYYLIPETMAEQLSLTAFRKGNSGGYVVTSGDLTPYGIDKAVADGAHAITEKEAAEYIKNLNRR